MAEDWQLIETAPKTRSFCGWHENWFEPEICRWMQNGFYPRSAIEALNRWEAASFSEPTHWRPRTDVPEPP